MNPELRRNIWLELTPRRVVLMVAMLGLALFASALGDQQTISLGRTANFLYYAIVVLWGTRNAALAVVGEIRERTWDSQRLSALTPAQMTWGKLFGSTIYNWFGGVLLLVVIFATDLQAKGLEPAVLNAIYLVAMGVIAQATSLLASLVAIRRSPRQTRLGVFGYQILGLVAASVAWQIMSQSGLLALVHGANDQIAWWGQTFDSRAFIVASLVVFTAWILLGCYRVMRVELQMRNGPLVWAGFLIFMGLYVAGFDAWLSGDKPLADWDAVALRLVLAVTTYVVLTYLMVLLEPKDIVHYRWIGAQFGKGRVGAAFGGFQAWMTSYLFAAAATIALNVWIGGYEGALAMQMLLVAGLGFLTRDIGLFVLFQTFPGSRRGDFGALMALLALYALIPVILNRPGFEQASAFFYPRPTEPLWLGPAAAWGEAIIVAVIALTRIAAGDRRASN